MENKKFTLLELLVIISIICILITILLPSLKQSREKARQAVCMSNMNQIYKGIISYSQDWNNTLAPSSWGKRLPAGGGLAFYSDNILTGSYTGNKGNYGLIGKSSNSVYFCPSTPEGEQYEYQHNPYGKIIFKTSMFAENYNHKRKHYWQNKSLLNWYTS